MLKLKKAILALGILLALALSLDVFTGDAQTRKGTGAKPAAGSEESAQRPKLAGLPPKMGVDYKKFDHGTHSLSCEECHTIKGYNERVTQFPGHAACQECHDFPRFTIHQGAAFCLVCHETTKNLSIVKSQFPDQRDDQFGIKLPHSIHVSLSAKDFNLGNFTDILDQRDEKEKKIQEIAKTSGCAECHTKEGKEKKEENFSPPHHPECNRCHGVAPKNVAPNMTQCLECHKPFSPNRPAVNFIVPKFRHDRDHEADTRKGAKKGATLQCQFCHKQPAASKRLFDIEAPLLSNCTICHNDTKDGTAHALTPSEQINLKQDAK
jgi:hypothetical protein